MKHPVIAGVLFLASQWALASQAPERLVAKFNVQVPYGVSAVYYNLQQAEALNPIRILYTVTPGCPLIPATGVQVKYEGSNVWNSTVYGTGGYYSHSNSKVTSLKLTLEQCGYQYENCELNILEKAEVQQPETEVYAGYLPYAGGFAKDQKVEFSEVQRTNKLKLDVPDFCSDVEILDVRIKMAPQKDAVLKKSATEANVYTLKDPLDFDKVFVTLNGPKEACDIPIYSFQKAL